MLNVIGPQEGKRACECCVSYREVDRVFKKVLLRSSIDGGKAVGSRSAQTQRNLLCLLCVDPQAVWKLCSGADRILKVKLTGSHFLIRKQIGSAKHILRVQSGGFLMDDHRKHCQHRKAENEQYACYDENGTFHRCEPPRILGIPARQPGDRLPCGF